MERLVFVALLLASLAIIIIPNYYLTCDGPSHTYNAKIFFDFLLNRNRDFYEQYFAINKSLDPNWLSQIILGILMELFNPRVAEKIFQCALVVSFALGLRYLIFSINKNAVFLSALFYPFCFTIPLQTGFYNYCLGLALGLFLVGYYIKHQNNLQAIHLLFLAIVALSATLSHGMAASNAILLIGFIFFFQNVTQFFTNASDRKKTVDKILYLALCFLPSVVIIVFFAFKRGRGITPHIYSKWEKLMQFLQMYCSRSTRFSEVYPALAAGILVAGITFFLIRKSTWKLDKRLQALWAYSIFIFISYITCPQAIGGSGSIDIRLAFLPPLFLLVSAAVYNWSLPFKIAFVIGAFIIQTVFLVIRFPYVLQASSEVVSILKPMDLLTSESSILTLHYSDYGSKKSFQIDNSFLHCTDYFGTDKQKQQLIILNYEADLNYFAMQWLPNKNPRLTINNLYQGIYPPCGNPVFYQEQVSKKIDYVHLLDVPSHISESCTKQIMDFVDSNYICIYKDSIISNSSLWKLK